MIHKRSAIILVAVSVVLGCSACSSSSLSGPNAKSTQAVVIPKGWKSYTYRNATISVPPQWLVARNPICFSGLTRPVLILDLTTGASTCPNAHALPMEATEVVLIGKDLTVREYKCPSITVNDLTVYPGLAPGPCTNADDAQYWTIPSLRMTISWSQPGGVTGRTTNTIENQVLHTL